MRIGFKWPAQQLNGLKATLVDDVKKKKLTTREDLGAAKPGDEWTGVSHKPVCGQKRGPVCGEVSSAKPAKHGGFWKGRFLFGEISKVPSYMEDDVNRWYVQSATLVASIFTKQII